MLYGQTLCFVPMCLIEVVQNIRFTNMWINVNACVIAVSFDRKTLSNINLFAMFVFNRLRGINYNYTRTHFVIESLLIYYCDVIMGAIASQITSLAILYPPVHSGAGQRKYQSFVPLAFVRGNPRSPVNSPHKWPVTRKCLYLMT